MTQRFLALATTLLLLVAGCSQGNVYTLYRTSTVEGVRRIHVATFDAAANEEYKVENCQLAASLFQAQPGIATKFWCEKGRYRQ
jgi:hypothetical protein